MNPEKKARPRKFEIRINDETVSRVQMLASYLRQSQPETIAALILAALPQFEKPMIATLQGKEKEVSK